MAPCAYGNVRQTLGGIRTENSLSSFTGQHANVEHLPVCGRCDRRGRPRSPPPLRLTPYAWAKLLYLRDLGETEVGLFGVSKLNDLLLVEEVHLVRQRCSAMTVKFDDQSVADYFDGQVDQGRAPEQFARIWVHTHPGDSPLPSVTDEETFTRCFGGSNWAIMLILACGGQTYARLRLNAGPGGELRLPVEIDFQQPFPAADQSAWDDEYVKNVTESWQPLASEVRERISAPIDRFDDYDRWLDGLGPCWDPFDPRIEDLSLGLFPEPMGLEVAHG
jgi:hypothetical protein